MDNLLAYNETYKVYPYKGKYFEVTSREDKRYINNHERIGVFNTMLEAIKFLQRHSQGKYTLREEAAIIKLEEEK